MYIRFPIRVSIASITMIIALAAEPVDAQCPVDGTHKLQAGDGGPSNFFGRALSAEGDTLVVTATGDDDRGFEFKEITTPDHPPLPDNWRRFLLSHDLPVPI